MYQAERLPPHSIEAEESVLGSLMLDEDAVFKVAALIKPDDFYHPRHKITFQACLNLYERREPINQVTLAHELTLSNKFEEMGGHPFLSSLVLAVPTSVFVEHYAEIVRQTSLLRKLIGATGQMAALAYEGGPDADAILDKAEDVLFHLRTGSKPQDFVHVRDVIDEYLESSGQEDEDAAIPRILSGFDRMDRVLGGLHRSDLVILAARPGLGKTSLALSVAYNAAVNQRAKVAVFSLEMTKDQLVERLISAKAGIDVQRLRLGHINNKLLTNAENERMLEATSILSEASIYLDDTPMVSTFEMRSKARRLHYDVGLDLVIVDYLQLIYGAGGDGDSGPNNSGRENRVQVMSEISRSLKVLARELKVPVLALSQLSRAVEARQPHIPQLSDLRESGSIEQDADVVMFIYRDDAYFSEEEWNSRHPNGPRYPEGIANIFIAKHRNGPTGQVDLFFQKQTASFWDLAAAPA